ncbi:C-3',4' desaturase CrtD [Trichothermofontia sp.]
MTAVSCASATTGLGQDPTVIVVGAGVGGLTAAALLARRGYRVRVLEQAWVPGGCASTFQRRGFTFDVGATQVAGLEPGGIHHRIFTELGVELPAATPCDPACAVYLPGETEPIRMWRDRDRWQQERQRQFPGSDGFWQLLDTLFQASWAFQSRDPILPPRNLWDLGQLLQAIRPDTLLTVPFTLATVGDALRLYGLEQQWRLKRFLDLQLKLYSQVEADETALLYAATALGLSQSPHGLFHLKGSMQVLSDRLVTALTQAGGQLSLGQSVAQILTEAGRTVGVVVRDRKTGACRTESADIIIANVTVQNLVRLLDDRAAISGPRCSPLGKDYQQRVEKLPPASGAFVVYLGVTQAAIPAGCPPHLQFLYDREGPIGENNSLFVSVSQPGDGRAPAGQATIIASSFTDPGLWEHCSDYAKLKAQYQTTAIAHLGQFFRLTPDTLRHCEAATPRTFARYTGRDRGIVGGVAQRPSSFGPFGFAHRTPVAGLWLVGDSTHPGEGTAGVSYSAWTVVRQITAQDAPLQ